MIALLTEVEMWARNLETAVLLWHDLGKLTEGKDKEFESQID